MGGSPPGRYPGAVSNSSDDADFTPDTTANAAEGMTVQRVLFAPPADWIDPDLYFTVKGADGAAGSATPSRTAIELGPRTTVATDTYFGRFRASQWQRWTTVPEVTLSLIHI